MDELQKLFESDLLSEENKESFKQAVDQRLEEAKAEAKEEAKNELEADYAKKLTEDKNEINYKMAEMINEAVKEEIDELKEDIEKYRNLEVEYAKRLDEFKEQYKQKVNEGFSKAVEDCIKEEMQELKDDLVEAKKQNLGKRIFEAFEDDIKEFGVTDDVKQLREQLEETKKESLRRKKELEKVQRETTLENLLSNLSGSHKEVMRTILEGVKTENLEKRYNDVVDSVIREEVVDKEENSGTKPLNEDKEEGTIVYDNETVDADFDRMLSLSGLRKK